MVKAESVKKVAELARTVDLSRGKEEFLTVTVEVSGADPARLRCVQPVRADFQLLAGIEPEIDLVDDLARDPLLLGDTGDGGEAHAGGAADDLEQLGHRVDGLDRGDVGLDMRHATSPSWALGP